MLNDKPVLVVEDNVYFALDLSAEIECMNGRVVGPAASVNDALRLLDREEVAAAVLGFDAPDSDITPLASALIDKGVPFVIHATHYMPSSLSMLRPRIPVLIKPVQPRDIVAILSHEVVKFGTSAG